MCHGDLDHPCPPAVSHAGQAVPKEVELDRQAQRGAALGALLGPRRRLLVESRPKAGIGCSTPTFDVHSTSYQGRFASPSKERSARPPLPWPHSLHSNALSCAPHGVYVKAMEGGASSRSMRKPKKMARVKMRRRRSRQ